MTELTTDHTATVFDFAGIRQHMKDDKWWTPQKTEPPVPEDVYWSEGGGNFYSILLHHGMGMDFFYKWTHRRGDFPQCNCAWAHHTRISQDCPFHK